MNEIIEKIPLDKIIPDPRNRKHGGRSPEELAGLVESIKAHGVQEPAIVRLADATSFSPNIKDDIKYMLVAGERRFLASKLAGLDYLPCIVREMTDDKALAVQLIENLHRQDIHPLDEAEGYERLRAEAGYTAELIAQEVGRSPAYVYQRLRLQLLVPEVRGLLEEGKISTAAAMVVARLPEKQQALVYQANLSQDWQRDRATAANLEQWVRQNLLSDLKRAAWKLTDATLVKKAGACSACPKRTGVDPGLFEDSGPQKCLDPACFKSKVAAIIKKNRDSLEGTDYLVVAAEYWPAAPGALNPSEWREVKKSEPGALRALVMNGEKPGRLTWGKKIERSSRAASSSQDDDQEDEDSGARELHIEANREVNRKLFELVTQKAATTEPRVILRQMFLERNEYEDLSILAERYKLEPLEGYDDPAEALTKALVKKTETMDERELAALIVAADTYKTLNMNHWTDIYCGLIPYLELFQIDAEAVRAQVYTEKGVPLKDPEDEDEEADSDQGDQGEEEQDESEAEE